MVGLDRPRSEQRRLEPRLRAAAALGGLLHDAGKAICDVAATDETGRVTWSPIDADLDDWAARHGLARYFLRWREQRAHGGHAVFNLIALERILPPQVERWLSAPDPELYSGLVAAVTGVAHSSALVELVHEADRRSVEQDLREQAQLAHDLLWPLLPDDASVRTTPELGKLAASPLWPWVAERLDVVWQALYMAIQRLILLLAWWPFFAFVLVGAIGDGLLRRSIRQSGFDYPSPLAHRLALRGMLWLGVLVTLGLLAPLPVSPLAVPVIGTVAGMALAVMVTQTQKRL